MPIFIEKLRENLTYVYREIKMKFKGSSKKNFLFHFAIPLLKKVIYKEKIVLNSIKNFSSTVPCDSLIFLQSSIFIVIKNPFPFFHLEARSLSLLLR